MRGPRSIAWRFKGYALALSQNEILMEAAASYAPLAEALYTPDGVLAAIPMGDINAPLLYEVQRS